MKDLILAVIIASAVIVSVMIPLIAITYPILAYQCTHLYVVPGAKTEFKLGVGCMLTLKDGTVVPAESYRTF